MWPRAALEGSCLAHVDAGGLISYGPDLPDMFRRSGVYVSRILGGKGGIKPVDFLGNLMNRNLDFGTAVLRACCRGFLVPVSVWRSILWGDEIRNQHEPVGGRV
jgi:hypothetical protein